MLRWVWLAAVAAAIAVDSSVAHSGGSTGDGDSYSAICAVGRNENRFLREWVEYHLCLGFGAIHLFDHASDTPMSEDIEDLIESGRVSYQRFQGHHKRFDSGFSSHLSRFRLTAQGYAYEACLKQFSSKHRFIAFFDIDEFIVINDRGATSINDVLKDYESYGGVAFHWRAMGSSDHDRRPTSPVVSSYKTCLPKQHDVNRQIKSFVNTRFQPIMQSPHRAVFPQADDHKSQGPYDEQGSGMPISGGPVVVDEKFQPLKTGLHNKASWDRVAVYHYVTKSREDFEVKMQRGGGAGVTRKFDHFEKVNAQASDTCLEAIQTRERFCPHMAPS